MRAEQFDQWATGLLVADDHEEIVAIRPCTADNPAAHTRFEVKFASGASCFILINRVEGPNIPRHEEYVLPKEAVR
jgi:hypothetical protein